MIAVDLPGFGQTPPLSGEVTLATLTDAVQGFVQAEGLGDVDIVGSPMGARMVLEMARRGRGGTIVALDPGGFWTDAQERAFHISIQGVGRPDPQHPAGAAASDWQPGRAHCPAARPPPWPYREEVNPILDTEDPLALAVAEAIRSGEVEVLTRLLAQHPGLASVELGDDRPDGMSRSLLHVATDWPGHFPNGAETVAALVEAGADVNTRFRGPHTETPLHWAASNNDIAVLDALIDAGADIEAPGAIIAGGPRWPTPGGSGTGRRRIGWSSGAPAPL